MAAVVIASVSRIESIGILRLHIFGEVPQLSMPMHPRFFFFISNFGAYHLVRFHETASSMSCSSPCDLIYCICLLAAD